MTRTLTAAQMKALKSLLTPAQKEALGMESEPEPTEPKVPFLSCWTASRVNANAKGVFKHTNRKQGTVKAYKRLSEPEAIKVLKANYAAGRVYAIPAA